MLVVDLGSLKVSSDPTQERITNTKVCLKINVYRSLCITPLYARVLVSVFVSYVFVQFSFLYQSMTPEELEEKVYDRFDIELKQLQILLVKPGRCSAKTMSFSR